MWVGAVVQSKAGRDRYRLYIIIGETQDGRALIANGRLHTLESPKKKNLRHLTVLSGGAEKVPDTDDAVYAYLQDFENRA